jgi:hypothetical protein
MAIQYGLAMQSRPINTPLGSCDASAQASGAASAASHTYEGLGSNSVPANENDAFWRKHPGLVWSNRQAGDAVRIRAALMRPFFPVLLDIASHFGPERLEQEWSILCEDSETDTQRVEPAVSRILTNIRRGYEQARA